DHELHAHRGGEMKDHVAGIDQLGEHRLVLDRVDRVVKARVLLQMPDVFNAPGREIVDDEDVVAGREVRVGKVRTDETGTAGNENFQCLSPIGARDYRGENLDVSMTVHGAQAIKGMNGEEIASFVADYVDHYLGCETLSVLSI